MRERPSAVTTAEHIWNRELILVTGKGGVGKTTVAAALARAAQAAGRRVLLAEITSEVANTSPLLGLFGHPRPQGEAPVRLGEGLEGLRIMPSAGHRLFLKDALHSGLLANAAMRSAALNRFLMAAPAFPEIGTLYLLVSLLRQKRWDHIILDLPATGHALGLVSLPRTVLKILPASGLIGAAIDEGLQALTSKTRCGAVLVTLPEALPVQESVELEEGLRKLGVPVRAMVLNRMPGHQFSDAERAALEVHMAARTTEPVLGTREFRRLQRALDARIRFQAQVPEGIQPVEISMWEESADVSEVMEHVGRVLGEARPKSSEETS